MKKVILFILCVCVFACACDSECKLQLKRIADALELIAGTKTPAPAPKKTTTEPAVVANNWGQNLNHLNFAPAEGSQPSEFVFDDVEVEDSCEDQCRKTNYSDYTQKMCIKQNCEREY